MVAQPGSAGCSEAVWLLSQVALAKIVISKLFRMEREPSQVALAGSPEGHGYYVTQPNSTGCSEDALVAIPGSIG